MKKHIILLAIALIAVTSAGFSQNTVKKSFTGVKRIKISTSSGSCELTKSTGNTVEVEFSTTIDDRSFTPTFDQSGDRLDLGEEFRGHNFNGTTRWKLAVPDGMKVGFRTGSGDLIVSGLTIDLDANTGSGDLEFSTLKGTIDATTGSGNVEIRNVNADTKVNTGSGDMDVTDSEGDIDLNCGSGDIKLYQVKAAFSINTGSGNVGADKVTINGRSRFNTGSGRARVTLAATPTFDLAVNSGSGDAELNFNGNEIVGQVEMKAGKRWGKISAPFEFDKTEEISYDKNGDNTTIVKTAQRGKGTNRILVGTGSGDAVLKK
jgi:DUF4097 and DUF4098 domain-containing protein YvlB